MPVMIRMTEHRRIASLGRLNMTCQPSCMPNKLFCSPLPYFVPCIASSSEIGGLFVIKPNQADCGTMQSRPGLFAKINEFDSCCCNFGM